MFATRSGWKIEARPQHAGSPRAHTGDDGSACACAGATTSVTAATATTTTTPQVTGAREELCVATGHVVGCPARAAAATAANAGVPVLHARLADTRPDHAAEGVGHASPAAASELGRADDAADASGRAIKRQRTHAEALRRPRLQAQPTPRITRSSDGGVLFEGVLLERPTLLRGMTAAWPALSTWQGLSRTDHSSSTPSSTAAATCTRVGGSSSAGGAGGLRRGCLETRGVHVACKDHKDRTACFSGDTLHRETVGLEFGQLLDVAEAADAGLVHSLARDTGLELYLCQCPIVHTATGLPPVLPELLEDVPLAGIIAAKEVEHVNLWLGTGATHTNLHYDASNNLLCVAPALPRAQWHCVYVYAWCGSAIHLAARVSLVCMQIERVNSVVFKGLMAPFGVSRRVPQMLQCTGVGVSCALFTFTGRPRVTALALHTSPSDRF